MSKFSPTIVFETEFEGDNVRIDLSPLSRETYVKIATIGAQSEGKTPAERGILLFESAADVLTSHIQEMKGLRDANGEPVSVDTMLGTVYFQELVTDIYGFLVQESGVGKVTPTGSVMPSRRSSTERG
jgi:hypothetical protein